MTLARQSVLAPQAEALAFFSDANQPVSHALTLPAWCYTSPEFFDFEVDAVLQREWICVGRQEHVGAPGDFATITVLGEPLIVARSGDDGAVRVLSAVCQHRSHVIVEGSGNCARFRCPYDLWTYGTDGRLVAAPTMRWTPGFTDDDFRLRSLRTEIWEGFVFANFDDDAPPLAPSLAKLSELIRNFRLNDVVAPPMAYTPSCPWNWKVQIENSNDAYHASRLHGFAHSYFPSANAEFVRWDERDGAIVRTHRFNHIDGGFNPTTKALMPIFPGLTAEERWRAIFAIVPPLLTIGFTCDSAFYFLMLPEATDRCSVYGGFLLAPSAKELPLFEMLYEQVKSGVRDFNLQDVEARTSVQRGLQSRFAWRSRMSPEESPVADFGRWLSRRYTAAISEGKWPQ